MINQSLIKTLKELLEIDSPSGFCDSINLYLKKKLKEIGCNEELFETKRGMAYLLIKGKKGCKKTIAFSAHVDTLGLMVKNIMPNGNLSLTQIGEPLIPTLDGEYCKIYTRQNKIYSGTILCDSCSIHVNPDAKTKERTINNIIIRIDENISNKEDVKELGIEIGNFVAIEPKTQVLKNGFIKSRFLDNKINVACLLELIKFIYENKVDINENILFLFPNYEEIGDGCSSFPIDIDILYALDIGCITPGSESTEKMINICVKDYYAPYDYKETNKIIELCKKNGINYNLDSYTYYSTDVSAARIGGQDFAGVSFGPNVHASHGMERTHIESLENMLKLLILIITKK